MAWNSQQMVAYVMFAHLAHLVNLESVQGRKLMVE